MDTHNLVQSFGSCFTPIDHRSILLGYGRNTERYVNVLLDTSRRSDVIVESQKRNDVTVGAQPQRFGTSGGCYLQPWTECTTDGVRRHRHKPSSLRGGGTSVVSNAGSGGGVRGGEHAGQVMPPRDNSSSPALEFNGMQSRQLSNNKASLITQQLLKEQGYGASICSGERQETGKRSAPMTSLYHEDHVRWYRRHKAAIASSSMTSDISSPSLLFRRHCTTIVEKKSR